MTCALLSEYIIKKYHLLSRKKKLEKKEKEIYKKLTKYRKLKGRFFKWKVNEFRRILDRIGKEKLVVNNWCVLSENPKNTSKKNSPEKENVLQDEDSYHNSEPKKSPNPSQNNQNTCTVNGITKDLHNTPSALEKYCNSITASLINSSLQKDLKQDSNTRSNFTHKPRNITIELKRTSMDPNTVPLHPENTIGTDGNAINATTNIHKTAIIGNNVAPAQLSETFDDRRSTWSDVEIISNHEDVAKEIISIEILSDSDDKNDSWNSKRNQTNKKSSSSSKNRERPLQIPNSSTPLVNGMGKKFPQVDGTATSSVPGLDTRRGILTETTSDENIARTNDNRGIPGETYDTIDSRPVLNSSGNFIYNDDQSVSGGDFPCPICHLAFSSQVLLLRHSKLHQVRNFLSQPYICKQCQFRTTTQQNLTRHYKKRHRW